MSEIDTQSLVCNVFEIGETENTESGECEIRMICSVEDVNRFPNILYKKVSLTLIESEAE